MIDQLAEEQHAAVMAVAHALTDGERAQFLARTSCWPGMDGAEVADILSMTFDHDEYLDQTEPFFENFADQLPECGGSAPIFAMHALVILRRALEPARVVALLQKAGVTEVPRYPDAEAGILTEDGRVANSLFISARAEQAMRAVGVDEDVITVYRQSVRRTSEHGRARNVGDIAKWVTLVDRHAPLPRKLYDPVHDLAVLVVSTARANDDGEVIEVAAVAAVNSLRGHLDLCSTESAEAGLRAMFERGPRP